LEIFVMKKSLVALAVLAASGAAMAQSSVTIYGILDTYVASVKNENNTTSGGAGTSLTQSVLNSGAVNASRWGLKGSEDLGGGLKANFKLEQGITIDDGSAMQRKDIYGTKAAAGFNRQSWAGFSGSFGEVRLGNTTTPFDDVQGASDAVFDSALSPMNSVFKSTGYNARTGNAVFYATPDLSGFSGEILYSLGEDKTATTNAATATSLSLVYAAGPLALQFAYQVEDIANTTLLPNDAKFTRLGASYNFGVATLKANYGKVTNVGSKASSDATDFQIGADFPVSAALTLSASYAKSTDAKAANVFEASRKGFGLGAAYTLSKRTFVYGGLESDTATTSATTADAKHTVFAAGVQHRF
jgi:predicted porin